MARTTVPAEPATPASDATPALDGDQAAQAARGAVRLARALERAAGELSLAHFRTLSAIDSGDARASRLAAKLSIGKPTVSATVDTLCRRGLVTRSTVDGDQRGVALALTAEGAAVLARAQDAMAARIVDFCRASDEPDRLLAALAELEPIIEEAVTSTPGPVEAPGR